jgi:hypothetical protein
VSQPDKLSVPALLDGQNLDFAAGCQDNIARGSPDQSQRDGGDERN